MSLTNWLLWAGGVLIESVVFCAVILSVRRLVKPPPKPKREVLHGELIIQRPELPTPPRKELTR